MGGIGGGRLLSLVTSCFSWLRRRREPIRKVTLLMVGLDQAGKSTAAKGIQGEAPEDVVPTVGFSRIDVRQGRFEITIFDLGGGQKIRAIWKNYYAESHGVIFVVDSSDEKRMEEAREAVADVLSHPRISGKPVLVLANKQEKEGALAEGVLIDRLCLEKLVNRQKCACQLKGCSAVLGSRKKMETSIKKGLDWLLDIIGGDFDSLNERVQKDTAAQQIFEEREKQERAERVRKLRKEREQVEREHATEHPEFDKNHDSDDSDEFVVSPFQPVNVAIAESEKRRQRMDKDVNKIFMKPSTEQEQFETQSETSNGRQKSTDKELVDLHKTVALTQLVQKEKETNQQQSSGCSDSDLNRKKTKKFQFKSSRIVPVNTGDCDAKVLTSSQYPPPDLKAILINVVLNFFLLFSLVGKAPEITEPPKHEPFGETLQNGNVTRSLFDVSSVFPVFCGIGTDEERESWARGEAKRGLGGRDWTAAS
ncbi:LOW QUALITY PROTEIN: ADP-ribosylation factor-like protein 13B [Trichosurus vulpecula]|uniref:LOW QUALITY PROTEIN: ADP-ribosylation factor-like protein 13B n=1 Tax=Trichosurus vulpecula TaxID=9337 RepID=UPI00186B0019|nr:LOW QUALITY PROTEIN: ADP-ribosylation factor-like protein 13B [Trichosurus vulpecula]